MKNKHYKLELSVIVLLFLSMFSFPAFSQTFPDSTADIVIGQSDFVTGTSGLSQTTLNCPDHIALDTTVSPPIMYISDYGNYRVLGYYNYPFLQNNAPADIVIGQPDFVTASFGTTASSFGDPTGLAVDAEGNLWVTDRVNNRVLVFNSPTTTDLVADYVFGQGGSFTTADTNKGGISASSLNYPEDIAFDNQDRVYICFARRILKIYIL